MQTIGNILKTSKRNIRPVNNKSRVNYDFQMTALHIIEKLNIGSKRKSAYFAVCKRENPKFISIAFSFAVDHPNVPARDKMFFWKLNDLKKKYRLADKM